MTEGYDLVYPFLCVASRGGAWDDAAFVAGMRLGQLDGQMTARLPIIKSPIEPDLAETLDLAAMHHGYTLRITETGLPEWNHAVLTLAGEDAQP